MRIVVAGGSGLLGRALVATLTDDGHEVVVLTRQAGKARDKPGSVEWDPDGSSGPWASALDGADAIVNLAGAGIADRRWTRARKALLRSSRVNATRSLGAAVTTLERPPRVFVQGSAVGYYGASLDDRRLDESSPPGTDFLSDLGVEWEAAADPVAVHGCRLVLLRSGVVLTRAGGALPKMTLPFRLFVGGPVASGRQYLSWIAIDDWIRLVQWAIRTDAVSGPLNATAPEPVTNAEFSAAVARRLRRPNLFRVPAAALTLLFGELAQAALVRGQRVVPAKALDLGFAFRHPSIDEALDRLLSS